MMSENRLSPVGFENESRRRFLQAGGKAAAGSLLATLAVPHVHAAEDNTIRLALIGCGGRGSGAAVNAFEATGGPVKLVAMSDIFENRLAAALTSLNREHPDKVDVPKDRQFIGFDSYKQAIDCLKPGDVAMLCGYAGFRPYQLDYAVKKGINVFMEKSFASDPVGARKVIEAGEAAEKKNLKIAAGLMCRHSVNRLELIKRIRDGELGQIQLIRAYRMHGAIAMSKKPPAEKELFFQIRNFVHFYWVSGGLWAEMDIHQIDEICWLKDMWPVTAHGIGGRIANSSDCSQNLDSYSVEWTFPDGTKAYDVVRYISNCHNEFDTFVHGTKCAAQFSGDVHAGTVHTYKDQRCSPDNIAWKAPKERYTPWQAEWNNLLEAIRRDKPHNEAKRAALSNIADMMGRAAVNSGQIITWDQVMKSDFQWCPHIDRMTPDSPPPVQADERGHYPVPIPGIWKEV